MVDRHTDDKINKKARHAEFICLLSPLSFWRNVRNGLTACFDFPHIRILSPIVSASNQFARVGKILKRVQDDIKLGKFCSLLPAFTLAEVLITLGIIGVVAAMTIPTLMNKTNEAELKTAWKKQFSVINQAAMSVLNENGGGTFLNAFDSGSNKDLAACENMKDMFKRYLKYTKECSGIAADGGAGAGSTPEGCWHPSNTIKLLNNASAGGFGVDEPGLILADGTLVIFRLYKSDCSDGTGVDLTRCGVINVDVNGFKKPNVIGKDIFSIDVGKDRIFPDGSHGWGDPATSCVSGSTDAGNNGWGCSAKYLFE